MSYAVIEVGPATMRGPEDAGEGALSLALECIDDDLTLLDESCVTADDVWREAMTALVPSEVETIVLVCPTWWSTARIDRAQRAAGTVASTVVLFRRTEILRDEIAQRWTTVVEVASDLVVVSHAEANRRVVARRDGAAADADAVVAALGAPTAVLVDVPHGVDAGEPLGVAIADRLRGKGISVTFAGDVRRAAAAAWIRRQGMVEDVGDVSSRPYRDRRRVAVLAGVLSAVALCGVLAVRDVPSAAVTAEMPMTMLVEGRVGVMVPATWRTQRITAGPGSARVQVVSPDESDVALHVTQSVDLPGATVSATAESLRAALDAEPPGVFVDFNPNDHREGKAAVTYREVRSDHEVAWVVVVDKSVRIAIGCQSAPGREDLVREVCSRAVRSAHAVS